MVRAEKNENIKSFSRKKERRKEEMKVKAENPKINFLAFFTSFKDLEKLPDL